MYRVFFSRLPNYIHTSKIDKLFKERQIITIKNTSIKIIVDPKNGATDRELFLQKERDVEVINIMKQNLHEGSIFLDIGANIGYETMWGAHLVGQSGRVYSFEPLPHLIKQINESLELNNFSNVSIIKKASGEKEGTATLFIHKEDAGLTSIKNSLGATDELNIEITTVDKELSQVNRLDVIKLDVEGYEYEALRGGENIICKFLPIIIFEFSPHLYEKDRSGKSLELLFFLHDLGYKIFAIENLKKEIHADDFEKLVQNILDDETIPNFVASTKSLE